MSDTSSIRSLIAGAVGGGSLVIVGHPLDTMKVRFQLQCLKSAHYNGIIDGFLKIYKTEGIKGFYKGMTVPLFGVPPLVSLSFFGYNFGKNIQRSYPQQKLDYKQIYLAGMISGVFTTCIIVPADRIKCNLQNQSHFSKKLYNGPIDCFKKILKTEGFIGLYKGTTLTLLRDAPGSGIYFLVYEAILRNWVNVNKGQTRENASMGKIFIAGGLAGSVFWFSAIPFDTLKTRQQTAIVGSYKNLKDLFYQTIKNGGIQNLFKGLTPVMIRSFPANAACLFGYEYALKFMNLIIPLNNTKH